MKHVSKSSTAWSRKATTIRLPGDYAWKVLDRLTDDLHQSLTIEEFDHFKAVIRLRSMDGLSEITEAWGLQMSNIPGQAMSLDELRARYQLGSLLKKFQFETDATERTEAATRTFVKAEILCRHYNINGYKQLAWSNDESIVDVFTYARQWIARVIGHDLPSHDQLTKHSRHGPGASSNTKNGNTSQYFKYAEWPYDCTRRATGQAITAIQQDERWIGMLEDSYRKRHKVCPTLILDRQVFWENVLNVVPGNKITFVPKSVKTDRTIAIEPTMNLYLQLGVDGFIRRRLKRWDVNLNDQSKNQVMAKKGSIQDDISSFCTLDLSMASDTISMSLCRQLLPASWLHYLCDIRSSSGDLNGRKISYEKISSMGNGFTFALESLIFASLVYGVKRTKGEASNFEDACVYGDDIIVRKTLVPLLQKSLKAAGFTLNVDKSFLYGPIRESCGADWFKGNAIRPVFLKTKPTDIKELFNDYNRLKRLLSLRFGIEESGTLALLRSWIPSKFKTFLGPISDEEFDTYIHSKYPLSRFHLGHWKFKRMVRRPRVRKDATLQWRSRKLMDALMPKADMLHELFPTKVRSRPHIKATVSFGGSKFTVPSSNAWYFAYQNSTSDVWKSEYAELQG